MTVSLLATRVASPLGSFFLGLGLGTCRPAQTTKRVAILVGLAAGTLPVRTSW